MIRHRRKGPRAVVSALATIAPALATVAVLGAAPAGAAPKAPAGARGAKAIAMRENNLLVRVNAVRRAHGLSTVRLDSRLASSAKAWSGTMARAQCIWHDTARLQRLDDQMDEAALGETIAMIPTSFSGTAAVTMQAWMDSAAHRAEILAPGLHRAGVGIVASGGQYFITLDIGS